MTYIQLKTYYPVIAEQLSYIYTYKSLKTAQFQLNDYGSIESITMTTKINLTATYNLNPNDTLQVSY